MQGTQVYFPGRGTRSRVLHAVSKTWCSQNKQKTKQDKKHVKIENFKLKKKRLGVRGRKIKTPGTLGPGR